MAFEDVAFPDYPMKHDVSRSTIYPVTVRTNGTTEWRGTHVRFERFSWSLPPQTMTPAQKNAIRDFLIQRNHGLNSFRFQCPMTPSLTDATLSHNSGSYWNLYLPLSDGTAGSLHPLFNPGLGGLTVTVDGSPGTISGITYIDGVPVLDVSGTTGTEVVKISGDFYFTVKLVTPMNYAMTALDCNSNVAIYNVQPIELQEVFGETS